jgi:Bacterial protein of unknown function (Gcw_chp)
MAAVEPVFKSLLMLAWLACAHARAEWSGSLGLASDNIERGVSQSDRQPSVNASVLWRHSAGAYVSLGAASVSRDQFVGSDGYKLMPELGWAGTFDNDWRAGVLLRGQYFPGARGPWFGNLPPALQNRVVQAKDSDYATLEVGASLGWKLATLSITRALSDYLGLAATDAGPVGKRVIESKGTLYVGLDVDWPVTEQISLSAGAGRLRIPNFDALGYTDWRVGATAKGWGLSWGVQASGTNANAANYRLRDRLVGAATGTGKNAGGNALTASVKWLF